MSDHLPPEIIADIFLRLPLKPLLRFRLVSKQWLAQIDDSAFARRHVRQSTVTDTNNHLFIQEYGGKLHNLNFDNLRPGKTLTFLEGLHLPQQIGTSIIGTCDGLICTRNDCEDLMVFNPGTFECTVIFQLVPPLFQYIPVKKVQDEGEAIQGTGFGFGYDRVADDYKVVRIAETVGPDFIPRKSEAWVFHVNKRTRKVVQMPYLVRRTQQMGELVNGSLHWLGGQIDDPFMIIAFDLGLTLIIGFDLGSDEFRVMPLPEHFNQYPYHAINIGVLGSCLSVFSKNKDGAIDVYVMNEYWVKESWTKLVTFRLDYKSLRPLGYSYTGKEVMLEVDKKKLVWLDLMTERVHDIEIRGLKGECFEAFVCVPSLISPKPKPANVDTNRKQQLIDWLDNLRKRDDFLSRRFKLNL